jgi:hypothetical protein
MYPISLRFLVYIEDKLWIKLLFQIFIKYIMCSRALMTHAYNSSFLGSRDQEDHSLKTAWANSSWDPILKIPNTKKGWWSGSSGKSLSSKHEVLDSNPNINKKEKNTCRWVTFKLTVTQDRLSEPKNLFVNTDYKLT